MSIDKALSVRSENLLNRKIQSSDGSIKTIREWLIDKINSGYVLSIEYEDKIKPMKAREFFNADNTKQRLHEKRIKEAGKKAVYMLGDYIISKTEYDFLLQYKALNQDKEECMSIEDEIHLFGKVI